MNYQLINFYCRDGRDSSDRTFEEVFFYDDTMMEKMHNYVQWLFPTETPSNFRADAPLLDAETIQYLKESPEFRANFMLARKRMLHFWGLPFKVVGTEIEVSPIEASHDCLTRGNHNVLRVTRFLESCRLLGYEHTAHVFYRALSKYVMEHSHEPTCPDGETLAYWHQAAYGINKKLDSVPSVV